MKPLTGQVLTSDKTTSPCSGCIFYLGLNTSRPPKILCAVYKDNNPRLECHWLYFTSFELRKGLNIIL